MGKKVSHKDQASPAPSFYEDVSQGKINEAWKGLPWLKELASESFLSRSKCRGMLAGPVRTNELDIEKVKLFAGEFLKAPEVLRIQNENNNHIRDFRTPLKSEGMILLQLFTEYLSHKYGSQDPLSLQLGARIALDVFNGKYETLNDSRITYDFQEKERR